MDVFTHKRAYSTKLLISRGSGIELCEEYKTEKDTISGGQEGRAKTDGSVQWDKE